METEFQPLLQRFPENRKSIWRRIPKEVTITSTVVGLFLFVVMMLILNENVISPSDKQLSLAEDLKGIENKALKLLGSPTKSKDKNSSNEAHFSHEEDKEQNHDEMNENWNEVTDSPHEENREDKNKDKDKEKNKNKTRPPTPHSILQDFGEFVKNQKNLGKQTYQEKLTYIKWKKEWLQNFMKDKILPTSESDETGIEGKKPVEENSSEENDEESNIKILGSPFKFNKKTLDDTWQDKKEKFGGKNEMKDYNWNKKWNVLKTGSSINKGTNYTNSEPQNSVSHYPFKKKSNDYKYDKVNKGWKQLGLSIEAPSAGCPFRPTTVSETDLAFQQAYLECALLVEEIMKSNGKCIDLSFLPKECKPELSPKCYSRYKYRTYDGSCNNRIHPTWGKSRTPFVRMLAPVYGDGVSSLRKAKSGNKLPLARYLSQKLYSTKLKPDLDVSMLILIFGLFLDHDMIETALGSGALPCCDSNAWKHPSKEMISECLQIEVPPGDPFYGPRGITCINLKRSVPTQGECIGRREQLNKATSFIDASTIYGADAATTKSLRSYHNGQLRTQKINNSFFPAYGNYSDITCGKYPCFASGDRRGNMLTELTVMHILWYREHNRLAMELHAINPYWNDERLFQEARRLVIAQIQHIAYSDWLKVILGDEAMDYFDLTINPEEPYEGYDDTVNPSVYNVMAAAALRFGHSFIQEDILLIGPNHNTTHLMLHFTFFNVSLLHNKGLDWILRGASQQKVHAVDSFITNDARTKLFPFTGTDYGFDLASLGIQRSRDHGIPPYTKWRSACGLSEVKSWDDLNNIMDPYRAQMLRQAYEDVEDIDFTPAALAENHVQGTMVGPTHLCLIGRQFKKTRHGDRFWFETLGAPNSFTKDQLDEIYKSNIAKVMCDNSDGLTEIQRSPFFIPSDKNPVVKCEDIPGIDLSKWKE